MAVGAAATLPLARRTIDVHGQYVIPGLIDAHVHMGRLGELLALTIAVTAFTLRPRRRVWARLRAARGAVRTRPN